MGTETQKTGRQSVHDPRTQNSKTRAGKHNGKSRHEQASRRGKSGEILAGILKRHQGERHLIVIHAFPDPDAISSAFAHRLISARFNIEADIIYTGVISHRQNLALVKLLGIAITPYEAAMSFQPYAAAVFVDNQAMTSVDVIEGLRAARVPVLAVIDHHELQKDLKPEFIDIRQIGATASIYTEYLEHGLIKMNKSERDHVIAATALMHGILSDTVGFVRAGPADFQAAAYLSQFVDADLLDQITSQPRPRQTMDIIQKALSSRVVAENVSIAGVGYLREEDRDAISQTSAFLLTEENVHTALAYGIMVSDDGREKLIGSLRTSRPIQNADELIKEVFGKDEAGNYYGGGKQSAGAFQIPVGFLSGNGQDDYRELKWKVHDEQVKHKMFARIGIEHPGKEKQTVLIAKR